MEQYKKNFIEFLVRSDVLKFGDFTLKSGRKCPYFLNFGNVVSGENIGLLGKFYAEAVMARNLNFDVVFGPAYKGISIAVTTVISLSRDFDVNVPYAYNRKEKKDHGEGGSLVGSKISLDNDILILDDVMTVGTALRESLDILNREVGDVNVSAVFIAVDRMEKGKDSDLSAILQVKQEFGIDVFSIVNFKEIVDYLRENDVDGVRVIDDERFVSISNYLNEYGV